MSDLTVSIDGEPSPIAAKIADGDILVPLEAFCDLVGAEVRVPEVGGLPVVCCGDLCLSLNTSDMEAYADGMVWGRLSAFGEAVGLMWRVENGVLTVLSGQNAPVGLDIGQKPPAFTLPDLFSGEPVSLADYRGRKTVFYMWASW